MARAHAPQLIDAAPPLLVLVAVAGRPDPSSVMDQATANDEEDMNASCAVGNTFLRRSINGAASARAALERPSGAEP